MPLETSQTPLQEIGDYDLLAKIAEGGMGTVYKGRRKSDGLIVAIKIIPNTAARNPVLLQRFKREFEAAKYLDHRNLVKAIDYCGNVPTPFLVMEYVEGESLGQKIERDGKLNETEAIRIMAQVCQGLHRAHSQNMIHRDVKPDNVLLTPDGVAKLTDLGLVKDMEGELNLTRTGRGLGTPHFMAPEQFRNAKNADVRCDVYSLGATLYMMVTGHMPFDGCGPLDAWMKKSNNEFPPPKDLEPSISDRLDWAIRRAMNAKPELRPATCREFFEDISGKSTRPLTQQATSQDLWYMVYKDEEGNKHTVKGTTDNIRKAYTDGLLGDAANIIAARTKAGPFQPLRGINEFRDLVSETGPAAPTDSASRSRTPVSEDMTVAYGTAAANPNWAAVTPDRFPTPVSGGARDSKIPLPPQPQTSLGWKFWVALVIISAIAGTLAALFLPRIM